MFVQCRCVCCLNHISGIVFISWKNFISLISTYNYSHLIPGLPYPKKCPYSRKFPSPVKFIYHVIFLYPIKDSICKSDQKNETNISSSIYSIRLRTLLITVNEETNDLL